MKLGAILALLTTAFTTAAAAKLPKLPNHLNHLNHYDPREEAIFGTQMQVCYETKDGHNFLIYRLAMRIVAQLFSGIPLDTLHLIPQHILKLARITTQGLITAKALAHSVHMSEVFHQKVDVEVYAAEMFRVLLHGAFGLVDKVAIKFEDQEIGWSLKGTVEELKDRKFFETMSCLHLPQLITINVAQTQHEGNQGKNNDDNSEDAEKALIHLSLQFNERGTLIPYNLDLIVVKSISGSFIVLSRNRLGGWRFVEPILHHYSYPNLIVDRMTSERGTVVFKPLVLIYKRRS